MNFAHVGVEQIGTANPGVVIVLTSFVALGLLLMFLWLLKRFTSWEFPAPKKKGSKS